MNEDDSYRENSMTEISSVTTRNRYPSSDQQTKKVVNLQEQLLKTRKEMSCRQIQWQKQRNQLLSKHQISNMEIIQLKQRIVNLTQVNKTLTNVLDGNSETDILLQQIKMMSLKMLGNSQTAHKMQTRIKQKREQDKPISKQSAKQRQRQKQKMEAYVSQINNLKQKLREYSEVIQRSNMKIDKMKEVIETNQSFIHEKDQQIRQLKRKLDSKDQEVIQLHKELLTKQKREEDSSFEKVVHKIQNPLKNKFHKNKELSLQQLQDFEYIPKKYPKRDSWLMVKPTSDHISNYQCSQNSSYINNISMNESDYPEAKYDYEMDNFMNDDNESEQERLLCEVCNRVYHFYEFQQHMKNCKKLYKQKQRIQHQLQTIRLKEEEQRVRQKENMRYRNRNRRQSTGQNNITYYVDYVVEEKGRRKEQINKSELKKLIQMRKKSSNKNKTKAMNISNEYSNFSMHSKNYI